jgi:septal ring factor EnvC (AmiA/AmiB activator)
MGVTVETCCNCGIEFAMQDSLYEARKRDGKQFYCPNGHGQHYTESLQRKYERLKQENARLADEAREALQAKQKAEGELKKSEREVKRINTRVQAGVCTCCNRTFQNLARHMKTKHPNVVPLPLEKAKA